MTEHRVQVEELLAEYRRSREQLAEVHRELAAVSASASSADGLVTATVGARGALTDLTIESDAYTEYRPAELAAHIMRAVREATEDALGGAGEVMAPVLGRDADPRAVLSGTADLTAAELTEAEAPDDSEESFEDQNWLDDAEWSRAP